MRAAWLQKPPTTAKKLNSWLEAHFQVLFGPARAYVEFPIRIWLGNDKPRLATELLHRVVFVSCWLRGMEEDCCSEIARGLASLVTKESYVDARALLLVRTEFSFQDAQLYGRIAFWEPVLNEALMQQRFFVREGELARDASRITDQEEQLS